MFTFQKLTKYWFHKTAALERFHKCGREALADTPNRFYTARENATLTFPQALIS